MGCLPVPGLDPCVTGEEHLDVANTLNNLSILYSHIGEKAKALEEIKKLKATSKPAPRPRAPSPPGSPLSFPKI